ncbi:MAG: riboflavin biosynthesis protein RibD [Candidatus Tectimicrobiota bacterium]|nr:MAG: riboflavin biosynthesis protein RibD [Candidatus Tectomicrobia bacterium]
MTPPAYEQDVTYMRRALALAVRGTGWVSPNPLVGCVIVRGGEIVGEGYHQRFGGPHAEVYALQQAGERARGADLYVNLEPCCHQGKTPPCVEAIVQAGVRRVVVALRDPNPLVNGGGLARLQAAGIAVTLGVCAEEARRLNEAFVKYITTRRPFVILKSAITLDGKIATRTGASRWITGEAARLEAHRLRHAADALMVGIGTVLADDPQLTTRLPDTRGVNPLRVIVDSRLRLPLAAQVAQVSAERRTLVATTAAATVEKQQQLQAQGVEVVRLPADATGRVDLDALLDHLGSRGLASLLVEGGATLSAALLRRRLVDKVLFFVAPKLIGGDGLSAIGPCGVETLAQALPLRDLRARQVGADLLLEAYVDVPPLRAEERSGTEERQAYAVQHH